MEILLALAQQSVDQVVERVLAILVLLLHLVKAVLVEMVEPLLVHTTQQVVVAVQPLQELLVIHPWVVAQVAMVHLLIHLGVLQHQLVRMFLEHVGMQVVVQVEPMAVVNQQHLVVTVAEEM
jgi:hypothetical protein